MTHPDYKKLREQIKCQLQNFFCANTNTYGLPHILWNKECPYSIFASNVNYRKYEEMNFIKKMSELYSVPENIISGSINEILLNLGISPLIRIIEMMCDLQSIESHNVGPICGYIRTPGSETPQEVMAKLACKICDRLKEEFTRMGTTPLEEDDLMRFNGHIKDLILTLKYAKTVREKEQK